METQSLFMEKFDSKENIEACGFTYVRQDPFYLYYRKDGLLYLFDANRENHRILLVLEE